MHIANVRAFLNGEEINLGPADGGMIATQAPRHPSAAPFEMTGDIGNLRGWATVCEVAPCVFVFAVEEDDLLGVVRVAARLKPDSPSIPMLRARLVPPTPADHKAADKIVD